MLSRGKAKQPGEAGGWNGPHLVTVGGPFDRVTGVVLKHQEKGYITCLKIVSEQNHQPTAYYYASKGAVMIIIQPKQEYCWIQGEAQVKYIT